MFFVQDLRKAIEELDDNTIVYCIDIDNYTTTCSYVALIESEDDRDTHIEVIASSCVLGEVLTIEKLKSELVNVDKSLKIVLWDIEDRTLEIQRTHYNEVMDEEEADLCNAEIGEKQFYLNCLI